MGQVHNAWGQVDGERDGWRERRWTRVSISFHMRLGTAGSDYSIQTIKNRESS